MLTKRIIPCLDVKDGKVVKGMQFKNHEIVGDILKLAEFYSKKGADELVFYDITASSDNQVVDKLWVKKIAEKINIPFCVAGGIRTLQQAEEILNYGADKISINSPALENPKLIEEFAKRFGTQCVVVGIDSKFEGGDYVVYKYTGREEKSQSSRKLTKDWARQAQEMGAGEIVLNCMNKDGMREGYDLEQLYLIKKQISIPLIASGGAGKKEDFLNLFQKINIEGALAASIFHKKILSIKELKDFLKNNNINIRKI